MRGGVAISLKGESCVKFAALKEGWLYVGDPASFKGGSWGSKYHDLSLLPLISSQRSPKTGPKFKETYYCKPYRSASQGREECEMVTVDLQGQVEYSQHKNLLCAKTVLTPMDPFYMDKTFTLETGLSPLS